MNLPEPFASIPRHRLLFGPSPIDPLPRLSSALGGKAKIYAKREDCNSGIAFGGNKVRKLEYHPPSPPPPSLPAPSTLPFLHLPSLPHEPTRADTSWRMHSP